MQKIDRSALGTAAGMYAKGMYWLSVKEQSGNRYTHCFDLEFGAWTKFSGLHFTSACVEHDTGRVVLGTHEGDTLLYGHGNKDNATAISTALEIPFHSARSFNAKSIRAAGLLATRAGNASITVTIRRDFARNTAAFPDDTTSKTQSMVPTDPEFYWGQSAILLDGTKYYGPKKRELIEIPYAILDNRWANFRAAESGLQDLEIFGYNIYGERTAKS